MEQGKLFDEYNSAADDQYTAKCGEFNESMRSGFWSSSLFNFSSDIQDFKTKLSPEEREVISKTLAVVGNVECRVKTWWWKLGLTLPRRSFIDLGITMANTEVIHFEAYSKLLKVLGLDELFESSKEEPLILGRDKYLGKYSHRYYKDSKKQFIYAMILFTLFMENVSLFSQFYIILWFGRYKNVLKDTNQQVMYTKNEELVHSRVGMWIVNQARKEYPELFDEEMEQKVLAEAKEAFEWESKIIDWLLGDYRGERLSPESIKEYIKSRINESMQEIGYQKPFELDAAKARDYEWMDEEVIGNNFTDFFYKRPVNYSKANKSFDENDLF
ncbi:MAG: Ribonucleoside-diphosphate reductase subunit beta [Ignavibacteriaceae bacterium]|nr:Ribonucleoside-diphosphate reductase subunit beta [Ignavibacteriaceae bacterium]